MISIVIPAYNEANRIEPSLKKIRAYFSKKPCELIVVDDGSTDKTRMIAERYGAVLSPKRKNQGKGYSVKQGLAMASGEHILMTDADLSTPIEEIRSLSRYLGEYDVIVGSRGMKKSRIVKSQPLHRVVGGKIINIFIQLFAVPGIKDTQCGFKLFTKDAAKDLARSMSLKGFSFDVELLFIARKRGWKIKEVPVEWANAEDSRVDPVKDGLRLLRDIFLIRLRSIQGRYVFKSC